MLADSTTLFHSVPRAASVNSASMLVVENRPPSWNAPATTVTVGTSRKTPR